MPSEEHTKAISNFPLPRNAKELRSFIGLASYFRKFVENFALIAKPLYSLLKKDTPFNFEQEQCDSFNKIKSILVSRPVLCIYSPLAETQLHCDASSLGFGGIIMQKQEDGLFHPIFYFSQRCTEAESKLHSFELELLAVVNSLKRFQIYLQGITFIILTDCSSFTLALKKKDIHPKIMRWSLILEEYDWNIERTQGCDMQMHLVDVSTLYYYLTF